MYPDEMNSDLLKNWKEALEGITNNVIDMVESHFLFVRTMEVATANLDLGEGGFFWDHLKKNYASAMVLGIARQVDDRKEVESLHKFLKDLKKNHKIITKDWYASEYEKSPALGKEFGEIAFEKDFGSGESLDETIVQTDIDALVLTTSKIEDFRHKRVAHKNKDKTLIFDVSFDDLTHALEELERIVKKYQVLINQSGMELMPAIQYDWEKVYRVPWIKGSD
ncbi:MAG: methylase [Parcubacteria group bacterium]|nr:methylase [Parcubacteria group bacterium]